MDLFTMSMERELDRSGPLAERMRPESLDDFFGQDHLLGEGKFLSRSIKADRIPSMILYGPPGTGKTSLAMIIAKTTNMRFEKISAVTSGVKDIREVVFEAEENLKMYGNRTILFIDEIHRFNKSQQDALLPYVERGILILIGATTENPYFEVNKALLSRLVVLELESLRDKEILALINRALKDKDKGLGDYNIKISEDAIEYLVYISRGDARIALNSLELGVLSTDKNKEGKIIIGLEEIENSVLVKMPKYDKSGDEHYNTVSAFIKSMRGSDPDASLYWLAKMISAGEDPKFIARRILIAASEDVGNADPNALLIANAAFSAVERVGMPEARMFLSQATLYVATAPKSNASYTAIDKALDDIENKETLDIPRHIRDSHYSGAKDLGHGENYKYPHDYHSGYVEQDYTPGNLTKSRYYKPRGNGYEKEILKRLETLHKKE